MRDHQAGGITMLDVGEKITESTKAMIHELREPGPVYTPVGDTYVKVVKRDVIQELERHGVEEAPPFVLKADALYDRVIEHR